MNQKDQVEIIKLKIKNEKEYLKELVKCKEKAKEEFKNCLVKEVILKMAKFESECSHVSDQYIRVKAIIEVACALDLISSVEFAELSDEISELAFS